jgi:hypothetical protein
LQEMGLIGARRGQSRTQRLASLVRFVFLTRGGDTCQDRKTQKDDAAHRDPPLWNMQEDGAIAKAAD